jgi:RNA polymerase sigma-70 factor (ECF subfamily)
MTDEEFIAVLACARAGDNEAMERLIKEYEPQVLLVARKRMGPLLRTAFDSADLVHSVHRSILVHLRQNKFELKSPKDLIALTVDMVKKKAAKKWRRLNCEQEILKLFGNVLARQSPERAAKLSIEVRDLLESLTEDDRKLLQLYLDAYTTREIADTLRWNPGSVRVRLSRIRRKLRDASLEIE